MRQDFFKILVERPRKYDEWSKPKYRKKIDEFIDDLPKYASMKRSEKRHNPTKVLNENLSPLWRFFEKNIGRPWNDVWAEICKNIDSRSTVKNHVKQHAYLPNEYKIMMIGGIPHRYDYGEPTPIYWPDYRFYVNPETGILERPPKKPKRILADVVKLIIKKDEDWYELIKGNWFWFCVEKTTVTYPRFDKETKERIYPDGVRVVSKTYRKSCNKKEIKWINDEIANPKNKRTEEIENTRGSKKSFELFSKRVGVVYLGGKNE